MRGGKLDCVVIGGGQAGLAASHHLAGRGIEHVVLERGRVAETWRSARWDGFHLNTPNWTARLPGAGLLGDDPEAFASRDQVIAYLDRYATRMEAPIRTGVEVSGLRHAGGTFQLTTGDGRLLARSVVVASGAFQQPRRSEAAAGGVAELHSSAYRNPGMLPDGPVLIVGSGQSGCEIAQELLDAGREVHVAVGRCPWAPRRYRGRELIRWAVEMGLMDQTAESLPSAEARVAGNMTVSGARGGVDCSPLLLERDGALLHGHLTGFDGGQARFADDLGDNIRRGQQWYLELCARMDDYAEAVGLELPPPDPLEWPDRPREGAGTLDLDRIGVVLHANGFRPAFGWIDLPVFDRLGFPRADRGVTAVPGLAFLGLPWLHTRRSPLLLGVGDDATHVAAAIAAHLGHQTVEDPP